MVRDQKRLAADPTEFERMTRELIEVGAYPPDGVTGEELRQAILGEDESNWKMDHPSVLVETVRRLHLMAGQIAGLRWTFSEAPPGERFITGDNPVVIANPSRRLISFVGVAGAGPEVMLTFPISPDLALLGELKPGTDRYRMTAPSGVDWFNTGTILGATQPVCADHCSEKLDAQVQQLAEARILRGARSVD